MTNANYKFYSVLKNEDAMPFVGNNLLIVADGLGGSGSTVHNIELLKDTALHDEIFETAFCGFDMEKAQGLESYLEHLVDPMADGVPDTSALWGSRIAIARCAYALSCEDRFANANLAEESVRQQLVEFIMTGLDHTVKYFKLEKGRYDDQKLLPTTLALIRYKTDMGGKVIAEVVWAGDSRCYALTRDGLKLLTVDDEDKSGSITNLFHVGGKKPTVLNYRQFVLNNPCVLMAVSDGIFDPFEPHDNFGVETVLLDHILGSTSYEELMGKLKEYYGKIHSDDATMAFSAIGFKDYADLQNTFAARGQYVADMWRKFCEANCALEVINQPEEDVRGYVETRTADKFVAIIPILLAADEGDIAYTAELKKTITEARARAAVEDKVCKHQRMQIAIDGLYTHLVRHPEECFNNMLNTAWATCVDGDVKSITGCVLRDYEVYKKAVAKKTELDTLLKKIDDWRGIVKERAAFYWQKYNELLDNGAMAEQEKAVVSSLNRWTNIGVSLAFSCKPSNIGELEPRDKSIAKEIIKFFDKNNLNREKVAKTKAAENGALASYLGGLKKLFFLLRKDGGVCLRLFNVETVERFGLTVNTDDGAVNVKSDKIYELLLDCKEVLIKSIVDSLAKNYGKTSVIDCNYNATRLNAFREYYRLKANPDNSIGEFEKQLGTLEKLYENLLQ